MLVCWLVGRLVSGLVGRSVCHNILKGREVTHPCSEHLCNKRIALWWELFFFNKYYHMFLLLKKTHFLTKDVGPPLYNVRPIQFPFTANFYAKPAVEENK